MSLRVDIQHSPAEQPEPYEVEKLVIPMGYQQARITVTDANELVIEEAPIRS